MNENETQLRALELAESQAALAALAIALPIPTPTVSTQSPDTRFHTAWGKGWRHGYYQPDQPPCPPDHFSAEERRWFLMGCDAGFEALELIELDPKAEKKAQRARIDARGRTEAREECAA
jgi:hypothetical protein